MNFLWELEKRQTSEKESKIFQMLTPNLQQKILQQTYGKALFSIPLFTKNFSKNFLFKLLTRMRPINFDPNSIIYQVKKIKNGIKFILYNFQKGDYDKIGIYILDRGEVAMTYNTESNDNQYQKNYIKTFQVLFFYSHKDF